MRYMKPPLTFEDQAEKLINRGLIADRDILINRLKCVNYYRLTAYLYPYRKPDDTYKSDTTLELVWRHYTFDRQLRILVMDAVERVEVAVRTQLVYHFSHKNGAFGYTDKRNMPGMDDSQFSKWLIDLDDESKRSREPFIGHFNSKYGDFHDRLPMWMLAEIMSFGKMLTFFNGVDNELRRTIAREYGLENKILQSWLGTLNVVRNICAHHGRLWNRVLGYKPIIPKRRKYPEWHEPISIPNNRLFVILTILRFLLKQMAPTSNWPKRLKELFQEYHEVSMKKMGFIDGWEKNKLWET